MTKVTQILKEQGSQIQIITLKEFFNKIFASDKNAPLQETFWSEEQWKAGILGLDTSTSGGKVEHWFSVDKFNKLINIIDKKFCTLIEKVEAFVTYAKTIDSSLSTEIDQLDDVDLLKKCYESIFSKILRSDFSNIENATPQNVCKFLDKINQPSKYAIKVKQIVNRIQQKNELQFSTSIKWIVSSGHSRIEHGTFSSVHQKVIQIADNFFEFELYLTGNISQISSESNDKEYTVTIQIPGISRDITHIFCKIQALNNLKDSLGFANESCISLTDINQNTDIELKTFVTAPRYIEHRHNIATKTSYAYSYSTSQDGLLQCTDSIFHDANSSSLIHWNKELLNNFRIRILASQDRLLRKYYMTVAHKDTTITTSTVSQYNHVNIRAFVVRGIVCLN